MLKKTAYATLSYLAWLLSAAFSFYIVLKVWELVRVAYIAMRLNKWGFAATSHFSIVILGLVGLVVIIYLEHLYSEARRQGKLLRRFAKVTLVEVVLAALALVALTLMS